MIRIPGNRLLIMNFSWTPGVIRNTEPLDYEKNHNHILQVVAFDCGMKRSDPVLVSVKVNRVCRLGWTGKRITSAVFSNLFDIFVSRHSGSCRIRTGFRPSGSLSGCTDQLVRLSLSTGIDPGPHHLSHVASGQELRSRHLHRPGKSTFGFFGKIPAKCSCQWAG